MLQKFSVIISGSYYATALNANINRTINYCLEFTKDDNGKIQMVSMSELPHQELITELDSDITLASSKKFPFSDWYKGFALVEINGLNNNQQLLFRINSLNDLCIFADYIDNDLPLLKLPENFQELSTNKANLPKPPLSESNSAHYELLSKGSDSGYTHLRISGVANYGKDDTNVADIATIKINLSLRFVKNNNDMWTLDEYSMQTLDRQLQELEANLDKAEADAKFWHAGVAFIENHKSLIEKNEIEDDSDPYELLGYFINNMEDLSAFYNLINSYKHLPTLAKSTSNEFMQGSKQFLPSLTIESNIKIDDEPADNCVNKLCSMFRAKKLTV